MASLHIRPLLFAGVLSGAIFFGIGMAVLGYCPGTSIAGCGEGRRDAIFGVLGMFGGAVLSVTLFPLLKPFNKGLGDWGEITLPEATHTSPWLWIATLTAAGVAAFLVDRSRHTSLRAGSGRAPKSDLSAAQ